MPPGIPLALMEQLKLALAATRASVDHPLALVVNAFNTAIRGQSAAILVPAGNEALRFAAATNDALLAANVPNIPLGSSVAGLAFLSGQTIALDDASTAPNFYAAVDQTSGLTTKEYLAAPIFHRSQRLGVLTVVNRQPEVTPTAFSASELAVAERYAELAAILIRHRDAFERHVSAATDALSADASAVYSPFTGASLGSSDDPFELRAQIMEALETTQEGDLVLIRDLAERLAGQTS